MNALRPFGYVLGIVAIGAAALGGLKFHAAHQARESLALIEGREKTLQARLTALDSTTKGGQQQAAPIEQDNALLAAALDRAAAAKPAPATPLTRQEIAERLKKTRETAATGDSATAMREMLWCLDEALPRLPASDRSTQFALIVASLTDLGRTHPPAIVALQERLQQLGQQLLAGGDDSTVRNLGTLARALKDNTTLLALHDALPANDERRRDLVFHVYEPLVAAQRYREAAAGLSYQVMITTFETATTGRSANSPAVRDYAIRTAANQIEVLTGVGEMEKARSLAERVLKYDRTSETLALLEGRATRAGQPDLLKPLQK